jgi:hypothetical protein
MNQPPNFSTEFPQKKEKTKTKQNKKNSPATARAARLALRPCSLGPELRSQDNK